MVGLPPSANRSGTRGSYPSISSRGSETRAEPDPGFASRSGPQLFSFLETTATGEIEERKFATFVIPHLPGEGLNFGRLDFSSGSLAPQPRAPDLSGHFCMKSARYQKGCQNICQNVRECKNRYATSTSRWYARKLGQKSVSVLGMTCRSYVVFQRYCMCYELILGAEADLAAFWLQCYDPAVRPDIRRCMMFHGNIPVIRLTVNDTDVSNVF